jgi:zinc finger protein ZFPM1
METSSPHSEPSKSSSPEPPVEVVESLQVRSGEKRPLESDIDSNSRSPTPALIKAMPTLRLNIALASDPASNPEAKELRKIKTEDNKFEDDEVMSNHEDAENMLDAVNLNKAALKAQQSQLLAAPKSKENINNVNQLLVKNLEMLPRPNVFMCTPCGIRFSSLSTLEAHQTYYCSHRKDADGNPIKEGAVNDTNGGEPPNKSIKTGKQYACTQCSYSADKKVSLNRHMRMHQTSPAPSSTTSNGDDAPSQIVVQQIIGQPAQPIVVDRYCTDCDIRFSSTKTYRAHKQHYCSSRHREG